tara:strand:+ start:309 stop:593 length:285 start_codon:yes stop_codon:yes gene_type:complete
MIVGKAIKELCPNSTFSIENDNYSTIWWDEKNSLPKPTEDEVNAKVAEIETRDAHIYKRSREYPSIEEQLDMIYHDIDNWKATIKSIKDKYPKS